MMEYNVDKDNIIVFGDVHGDFQALRNHISKLKISNSIIIIAGDCGLGFYPLQHYQLKFEALNKYLKRKKIICYFIRGNHDDPSYFKENKLQFSNIVLVEDYSVIKCNNHCILCVGGAISIDREYRKRIDARNEIISKHLNVPYCPSYWEDEIPIYDEQALTRIVNDNVIDIVITHTSPHFAFKTTKKGIAVWLGVDEKLKEDLVDERQVFTKIYDFLVSHGQLPSKWVHGHFHEHNDEIINETRFIALSNVDYECDWHEV